MKETDLFPPVKNWLEEQGYEVFAEVQLYQFGRIIDVVGVSDNLVSVELKTTFGLKVLEQAFANCNYVDYSYCTIPGSKSSRFFGYSVANKFGIGIIEIDGDYLSIPVDPKRNENSMKNYLLKALCPEQKESIGGSKSNYITPYKLTMRNIKKFLADCPKGATFKEIANNVETHYHCTPENGIRQAIINFEVGKG